MSQKFEEYLALTKFCENFASFSQSCFVTCGNKNHCCSNELDCCVKHT